MWCLQEIKSNQERIATAEVRCNSLLAEREMLKGVEVRLKSELDSVRKDQQSRDVLLSNLQSIQVRIFQNCSIWVLINVCALWSGSAE